ncbi:transaldolase [Sanguibacter gelidistatuariae]|uniref:Transaldolase n=1 Tax=Sanguibacter gelidistatuariae TaxID=1814289 RepID=A0A1G6T628_9MICO|nr:transaldolase [Sanguibacter gelidistatuariae]SDD24518.1 transaldolase [Sanguibacter gelidistatuariae]
MSNGIAPTQSEATAQLSAEGVAIWLDDLSRDRITSGNLAGLMATRNVVGVTTNPTIFAGALAKGSSYSAQLGELANGPSTPDVDAAVWAITTRDVRSACDVLRPAHDASGGVDGRVSIEVDPRLARDTAGTIALAATLWQTIDRPNLFIKIPATVEGLPAITATIAAGISVNVTLIFSLERYAAVIDAYLAGIEQAAAAGLDVTDIGSVASFFVSRVDGAADAALASIGTPEALALQGKVAVANARLAYDIHTQILASPRWVALAALGAKPQRPLWASTGVKNPAYPDTLYVTELVADGVVNTMPEATLQAVADHGVITGDTITTNVADANATIAAFAGVGGDLAGITEHLETDGLTKFVTSWEELLATVSTGLATAQS